MKWQLSLLGLVAILLFILFWFGRNSNKAIYTTPIVAESQAQGEVNIYNLLSRFSGTNNGLNSIIAALKKDSSNISDIDALLSAGKSNKIDIFTAYALYLKGIKENDNKLLQQSANLFFESGTHDPDTLADKTTYSNYAIRACDIILKSDPKNLDALTRKAISIVYFGGAVMAGVGLLKEVESIDSNYVDAQHHLMILDLQSGQYKKAEKRLKKLVHLQPENQQYADLLLKLETQQIK